MPDAAPVPPPRDGKDWTWVLQQACPQCGYDAARVRRDDVSNRIRAAIARLRSALGPPGAATRRRPDVWSPLEYAAHVRDVCIVFGARLATLRHRVDPVFADWDQDATALADRYWEQDPRTVAAQLTDEGERIAAAFAGVRPDEWTRPGRRSNGSVFTVETLGRYFLHDLVHHVHDVETMAVPAPRADRDTE